MFFIANYKPRDGERPVSFDDSVKLAFYGLYKSATEGPCNKPRPGFFDVVGRAKIDAWASNGDKPAEDAMVDYVNLLDKLHAPWRAWSGIPEPLKVAVRPLAATYAVNPMHLPSGAPLATPSGASERSALSGIYGDFTSASSVAGRGAPSAAATPASTVSSAAWADGSPLPQTPGAAAAASAATRAPRPSAGVHTPDFGAISPALNASAIEGSGARSSLASSSSGTHGDGDPAAAAIAAPSVARTAIRWSLSPNSAPASSSGATPQGSSDKGAAAEGREVGRRLSTAQLAEMCGSLAQRIEAQRAGLADAHAALAAEEGELASLQASYATAVQTDLQPGDPAPLQLQRHPAPPPMRQGLVAFITRALRGWVTRLLRRAARYPLAAATLALLILALIWRLRRAGGQRLTQ